MGVIMHKGVAYGGGSNVEANPAGSATDDLSKVGIDGTVYDVTDADAVHSTDIGVASGVASLDSNGKVPSAQLPTYPTVNNGALTIQKNGSTVATFTANQSGNSNANISVPIQPSDINAAAESEIQSTKSTSGNPVTLTDAAPINAESLVVELEPKQSGSGTPSPQNVRPITGYDSVSVESVGKNLLDNSTFEKGRVDNGVIGYASGTDSLTVENGGVTFTVNTAWRGVVSGLVKVDGNTKYCLSYTATNDYVAFVNCYDANGDWISPSLSNVSGVFTTNENTAFINVSFQKRTTGTVNVSNLQLEKGETATTFEPYATSSATITLGQTVYGGTVDFKTGVVTITDANIASYAGETLPSTWISDRDAYSSGGTPTTGAQVVYKLATPTTLQLTPAELKLLKNTNNISTNGTSISLGYQPDNVVGELKGDIETEHERFYTETAEYAVTFLNNARCVILATSSSDYIPIAAYTDYLFVAIGQLGDNYVGYIKFPDMSEPSESELPIGTEIEFTVVFMRKE